MPRKSLVTMAMLILVQGGALASGGSSMPGPRTSTPMQRLSPEQEAAQRYNEGLKHQEKADKLAKEADAEGSDARKREKIESQASKEYEKAMKEFRAATEKNARMFQAYSGLGYTQRKLGNYDAALAAYNRALELEPAYSPAIEYRAEAFLGLNRLDDVKSSYMTLFNGDRKRADELQAAMKKWLEKRHQDPAGVAPQAIEEFSKWVAQREEIAGRTSALTQPKDDRW